MDKLKFKYCKLCDNGFFYRRESALYCSDACKQKAHRIANGQTLVRSEAARKTVESLSERVMCPHCLTMFWQNTKGRKRVFCKDSCRVSANRLKIAAAYKFVKWVNQMDAYAAFMLVQEVGTGGVDELALRNGCHYSYSQRTYTGMSHEFYVDNHA